MHPVRRLAGVVISVALMIWVVPRMPVPVAFGLFIACAGVIAWAVAPYLALFVAGALVDFIFSPHGTTADTDPENPDLIRQSDNVFSFLRTVSFLTLAAALYGFFWAVPILQRWPPPDDLTPLPPDLIRALVVGVASAAVWLFYLGASFLPRLYRKIHGWEL